MAVHFTGSLNVSGSINLTSGSFSVNGSSIKEGFPYTGSAQITGSLGMTGSIITKGPFSGDTTNHILSIGTLVTAMTDMSGSLGNRFLPAGYDTYQIYFNESSNGESKVGLYNMMSSSFVPITLDPLHTNQITIINDVTGNPGWIVASPGTTIEYAPSQSINLGEYIRLYYDYTPGYDNWRIIERGRLNERTISSGNTNAVQSITGSINITGSLNMNAVQRVTGSVNISGSLTVNGTSVGAAYKVYSALVTYNGSFAVDVLQNTLGETLTWSVPTNGSYRATSTGAPFVTGKTWVTAPAYNNGGVPYIVTPTVGGVFNNIAQFDFFLHDGTKNTTPFITRYAVEIRVYP